MSKSRSFELKICLLLAAAVLSYILFCGCGSSLEKYDYGISEIRDNLFAAENADYKITAVSGKREDPYIFDGVSNDKRDFTVITVTPESFASDLSYRYKAEIDGAVYEGDLLPHPFNASLSVDIPVAAKANFTLSVIAGSGEQTFEMKNSVDGELISAEKAFKIALGKMKDDIKQFRERGKFNCEIYVRLMPNPIDGSGGYFWYVAFMSADKRTVAVLLRGDTGAVAAVKV